MKDNSIILVYQIILKQNTIFKHLSHTYRYFINQHIRLIILVVTFVLSFQGEEIEIEASSAKLV
jgi:hypothetical protein